MQRENAIPDARRDDVPLEAFVLALLGLLEDPQPAITTPDTTTTAIGMR